MDLCLRMALCMVVLMGCLQAKPVNTGIFELLRQDVKCGPHVNFTSPTNVQDHCHEAALSKIKGELRSITTKCQPQKHRIDQALKALRRFTVPTPVTVPTNSSDCNWDSEGFQKHFDHFVKAIQDLCEKLNSLVAQG